MGRPSRVLPIALVSALAAACAPTRAPLAPAGARPVALVTEGSAFERPGLRDAAVRALEEATRRPVVPLAAPTGCDDPEVKRLAARLAREQRGIGAYDWREPRCAAQPGVLTAIRHGTDALYRISLDHAERTRPAEPAERAGAPGRFFGAIGLAEPGTVREETLRGTITVYALTAGEPRRVPVEHEVERIDPTPFTARLDVEGVMTEAIAALPTPPPPAWEALARSLTQQGCPFLALVVAETQVTGTTTRRGLTTAAVSAMRRSLGRRAVAQATRDTQARFRAALRDGDLDAATQILADYEASPARQAATARALAAALETARARSAEAEAAAEAAARAREDKYSCTTLCGMHMIELCNNDKALWSSHRRQWETTPCGARREEPFLRDCYQQQWLTGTFHQSCVRPCQQAPEGRERLLHILQGAGCVRAASAPG